MRLSLSRTTAAAVLCTIASVLLPAVPASASGDDYPYRTDTTNSSDQWGFTKRQCVSFAAWRLAQHKHPLTNSTQNWGNASHWDDAARARGVTVSTRPKVGSVAQWNAGERSTYYADGGIGTFTAGSYGHVAYVTYVYGDNSVRIEQYNVSGNRSYAVMRVKAPRYLYIAG